MATTVATVTPSVIHGWRSTPASSRPYPPMLAAIAPLTRSMIPLCRRPCSGLRSRRAAIIGVRVSDTTHEIRIATASVIANSRNSRPTTSPMNNSGIRTATSENVSEMIVKAIWREPFSAAAIGDSPCSV